jgi:hypothetical protein
MMNDLQKLLFNRRTTVEALASWASVMGMKEIERRCYGLIEAIDDEIERHDKAAAVALNDPATDSTAKEE